MKNPVYILRKQIRNILSEMRPGETVMSKPIEPKNQDYTGRANGSEVTILRNNYSATDLYVFMHSNYGDSDFAPYSEHEETYVGKDEEGNPDFEIDYSDVYIDEKVVARYVNDNLKSLSVGQGMEGWSNGEDLVKIDNELASHIFDTWPEDSELFTAMSPNPEVTTFPEMGNLKLKSFVLKGADKAFAWSILDDKNHLVSNLNDAGSLYIHPINKRFNNTGFEHNPINAVRFVFLQLHSRARGLPDTNK